MKIDLSQRVSFESRHNSATQADIDVMLSAVKADSVDQLIEQTIPAKIRLEKPLNLPEPLNEFQFLSHFKAMAAKNKMYKTFIGQGYYNCVVPSVILRNILENPGWYTAYTPYQAEIAQGRLEALINFQTMVTDLTGMAIANASLLDEGTAAAEAMTMLHGLTKGSKRKANKFFVSDRLFPQTIDILKTRSTPVGIELIVGDINKVDLTDPDLYGVFIQYPDNDGVLVDYTSFAESARENNIFIAVATDLLSLALYTPPGEWGADVVVGTSQRLGVPMGYGGPHAAFFATRDEFKRQIPGRIIGVSMDKEGKPAYRMALQTREQHIRREKATSNICTAQVLLAVMSGMYAVYHGADGLKQIALRIHGLTKLLDQAVSKMGIGQVNAVFFDTLKLDLTTEQSNKVKSKAESQATNFRYFENGAVGISFDETNTIVDVQNILQILSTALGKEAASIADNAIENLLMHHLHLPEKHHI
jgi:glycine dehydrogenase